MSCAGEITPCSVMQGRGEIVAMQQMIDGLQSSMRLLVASVRSPDDIVALASQVCIFCIACMTNAEHALLWVFIQPVSGQTAQTRLCQTGHTTQYSTVCAHACVLSSDVSFVLHTSAGLRCAVDCSTALDASVLACLQVSKKCCEDFCHYAGVQHLHNISRLRQPAVPGATDMAGSRPV